MDQEQELSQKLIGEFKKVQESIRKMKEAGYFQEAIEVINNISKDSFEFDVNVPKNMPLEDLMILLEDHRQLNPFQLNVLAELLMLEGEVYFEATKNEQSRDCFEKALRIFYHLDERSEQPFSIDLMERM
ncbi:MAG: hypothetical protein AAGI07_11645, partial [Bacteroidota bacterium]